MRKDIIWMPHPGHFICGSDCRFHLSTYVNGYIVSTVGELLPEESSREIHAEVRGIKLEGRGDARRADFLDKCGYVDIGYDRKYETMVFKAMKSKEVCCPWRMAGGSELDFEGYNDPGDACRGHMCMVEKYGRSK